MKIAIIVLTVLVILIGCWDMAIVRGGSRMDEELAKMQEELSNGEQKEDTFYQSRED